MAKNHVWLIQLNNLWNSQKRRGLFILPNTAVNLVKTPTLLRQLHNHYTPSIYQL